jgi:excisionase family DNA binding protein
MVRTRDTYSVPEAAARLGISKTTLYERIKEGRVRAFRWVGRTLIRADDLQDAIDRASGRKPDGDGDHV